MIVIELFLNVLALILFVVSILYTVRIFTIPALHKQVFLHLNHDTYSTQLLVAENYTKSNSRFPYKRFAKN